MRLRDKKGAYCVSLLGPSSLLRIGKEQYAPKKAPFGWPFLVCAFLPLLGNRRRIG